MSVDGAEFGVGAVFGVTTGVAEGVVELGAVCADSRGAAGVVAGVPSLLSVAVSPGTLPTRQTAVQTM